MSSINRGKLDDKSESLAMLEDTVVPVIWNPHAADRWARAVIALLASPDDPKNLESWGKIIGVSRGALRVWCQAAHLRPKHSLDFARLLRAVVLAQGRRWDPQNFLDIVDPRSLARLLERGGLQGGTMPTPPSVQDFMRRQQFVLHQDALDRLMALLARRLPALHLAVSVAATLLTHVQPA